MAKARAKSKSKPKSVSAKPKTKKSSSKPKLQKEKKVKDVIVEETMSETPIVTENSLPQVYEDSSPSENQQWMDYARINHIDKPFFQVKGTVYRTSDGKGYHTPEQFFADGGMRNWGNVKVIS